jgi:hypothetical protein
MKRLAFIFLISVIISIQLPAQSLAEIRSIFYEAVKDPSSSDKYVRINDIVQASDPLINAYIGGLKAMKANTVSNPFKKMKYFSEGKDLIEKAVNDNNTEWEIRFVRFMIQSKIPSFLLYDNINEDKNIILDALRKKDKTENYVKKIAIHFLVDYGKLNNNEMERLKN